MLSDGNYGSEIHADILLDVLLLCSFQRSFQSRVIPRYLTCLDQGVIWLKNLNSRRSLSERSLKGTVVVLSSLMEGLHPLRHYSRRDDCRWSISLAYRGSNLRTKVQGHH